MRGRPRKGMVQRALVRGRPRKGRVNAFLFEKEPSSPRDNMTTHLAPISHTQIQGDVGRSFEYAGVELRQLLTEKWSVIDGAGLVSLVGDVAETGSDTLRLTHFDGLGYAERMTAMATETEAIDPTGFITGYDSISVGRYGLGKEETFQAQGMQRAAVREKLGLSALVNFIPNSWEATIRYLMCTTGATFADSRGSTTSDWTIDNEIDLARYFNEIEGADNNSIITVRHPEQYSDLAESWRSEASLQFPAEFYAMQSVTNADGTRARWMNMEHFSSHDVTQASSAHQGFAFQRGAIAWCKMRTNQIDNGQGVPGGREVTGTIYLPQFGLVLHRAIIPGQATAAWYANAWFGLARRNASLAPQVRIVSQDD